MGPSHDPPSWTLPLKLPKENQNPRSGFASNRGVISRVGVPPWWEENWENIFLIPSFYFWSLFSSNRRYDHLKFSMISEPDAIGDVRKLTTRVCIHTSHFVIILTLRITMPQHHYKRKCVSCIQRLTIWINLWGSNFSSLSQWVVVYLPFFPKDDFCNNLRTSFHWLALINLPNCCWFLDMTLIRAMIGWLNWLLDLTARLLEHLLNRQHKLVSLFPLVWFRLLRLVEVGGFRREDEEITSWSLLLLGNLANDLGWLFSTRSMFGGSWSLPWVRTLLEEHLVQHVYVNLVPWPLLELLEDSLMFLIFILIESYAYLYMCIYIYIIVWCTFKSQQKNPLSKDVVPSQRHFNLLLLGLKSFDMFRFLPILVVSMFVGNVLTTEFESCGPDTIKSSDMNVCNSTPYIF